jgi:hypothetical protein
MTVQKLWRSIYFHPFTVRCVCYVTHSLTPGGQNLGQMKLQQNDYNNRDTLAKKNDLGLYPYITNISIVLQLCQPLFFTLINPIWEGVSVTAPQVGNYPLSPLFCTG